jgi:acetylornithine deacetylase
MLKIEQDVIQEIGKRENDIIRLTSQFLRIPSLSGEEMEAQEFFSNLCKDMGLKIDSWVPDIDRLKKFLEFPLSGKTFKSPIIVGLLKGNEDGRSLILSGHVDVVPTGEISRWTYGPWSGHIDNKKIYGRGASDMKGGLIAMAMALKCIIDMGIPLNGSVYLFSVTEEETGGLGILSTIERGYKADAAIIPEPTDLRICCASEGSFMVSSRNIRLNSTCWNTLLRCKRYR